MNDDATDEARPHRRSYRYSIVVVLDGRAVPEQKQDHTHLKTQTSRSDRTLRHIQAGRQADM